MRAAGAVLAVLLWLLSTAAHAHEFRPASLSLRAHADGEVAVRFVAPAVTAGGPTSAALRPRAPAHCQELSPTRWSCGEAGLVGTLSFEGLVNNPVDVIVDLRWPDGAELHARIGPDRPQVELGRGAAVDGRLSAGLSYLALGAEHVRGGLDHLLFLLALLLLGGRPREHLRTITAFTVGHSLALLVQTLWPLAVPGPWVEACITASIVVAAAEALRPGPRRAAAWRWALAFGVVHGLGFAGALAELGLPPDHRFVALLAFNLGVEGAQLVAVLGLVVLASLGARQPELRESLRRGLAFAVGAIATAWTLERVVDFWSTTT